MSTPGNGMPPGRTETVPGEIVRVLCRGTRAAPAKKKDAL